MIAAHMGEREEAVRLLQRSNAEGRPVDSGKHSMFMLHPLHGYPPYEAWIKPKG